MTPESYAKFISKVYIDKVNDCWHWTGAKIRSTKVDGSKTYKVSGGYGIAEVDGKTTRAHRASYEHHVGPIPEGLTIEHLCHLRDSSCEGGNGCPHRACVNPSHLGLATRKANTLSGKSITAKNAVATHCKYGHEFTPENTKLFTQANGTGIGRYCLACGRRRSRDYYHAKHPGAVRKGPYKRKSG